MRITSNQSIADDGRNWWAAAACVAILFLVVVAPVVFHVDVASGALLVGP